MNDLNLCRLFNCTAANRTLIPIAIGSATPSSVASLLVGAGARNDDSSTIAGIAIITIFFNESINIKSILDLRLPFAPTLKR